MISGVKHECITVCISGELSAEVRISHGLKAARRKNGRNYFDNRGNHKFEESQ
jgi:hypothetical protein